MDNSDDIGQLIENYSMNPFCDEVEKWIIRRRNLVDPPSFIMGFCATDDNTFREAIEYIRKKLNIPENQEIEFIDLRPIISKAEYDLKNTFKKKISYWNEQPSDTILVAPYGFENMPYYTSREATLQFQGCAHLFSQRIKEISPSEEKWYSNLEKVIVVVTHIGRYLGEERYKNAVMDADRYLRGNGFQDFNFELLT